MVTVIGVCRFWPTDTFGMTTEPAPPPGLMVRVRFTVAFWAGELESTARNVRGVLMTDTPGVPLICPDVPFSVNPVGKVPEIRVHVYAGVPPVAPRVWE